MPHPNRSQSSPILRLSPSQALDSCSPPRHSSMANPEPFPYNASIRRLGSRRPRPSVASIADVFVGSLVMAGHCHEHSPRGRGLSAMSMGTSKGKRVSWQDRSMVTMRQLSKNRMHYLGSPTERLELVHRPRAQRMFNSGIAQRAEEDEDDDKYLGSSRASEKPATGSPDKNIVGLGWSEQIHEKVPPECPNDLEFEPTMDNPEILEDLGCDLESAVVLEDNENIFHHQHSSEKTTYHGYKGKTGPRESLLRSTKLLYSQTIGESLDWEQAVKTVIDDSWVQPPKEDGRPDALEDPAVQVFIDALWDETKSNHYVFRLYRDLPNPGVASLSKRSRGALLRRFANPPNRRWVDARRYLALVEDMQTAKLPLSRSLWTSAIQLGGRASGKVFKSDLARSIGLWQQMEHVGGIKADDVVFTILFDIAIKAGQFTIAERLVEEMKKREINFRRAGKVSEIYYHGMVQDPEGIRQRFDEFVASGEIVDTVVMNCLLVSFLRAGETRTAEQLYKSMVQAQNSGMQFNIYKPNCTTEFTAYRTKSKELNRLLQLSPALKDELPKHHRALQGAFNMAPDTRTFHILLSHHAHESGNLQSFMNVLEDMERTFPVPPRGMIYLLLFDGFARNGRRNKGWTAEKLQEAWTTYLRTLYESKSRLSEKFHRRSCQFSWQNPLRGGASKSPESLAHPSTGLYTALPSGKPDADNGTHGDTAAHTEEHAQMNEEKTEQSTIGEVVLFDDEVYADNKKPDSLARLSTGFDTALPSGKTDADKGTHEDTAAHTEEHAQTNEEQAEQNASDEVIDFGDEVYADDLFDRQTRDASELDHLAVLERQIENGVFLGRRMIIIILRAFGACCGPKTVLDVWLRIETIWQPDRRKALDVLAVKEELEKQIHRDGRRF